MRTRLQDHDRDTEDLATAERLSQHARSQAQDALQATQRVAHDALEGLQGWADRGSHGVRLRTQQLRERAADAAEQTRDQVRAQPLKSLAMAAAAGAALVAVAGLIGKASASRRRV